MSYSDHVYNIMLAIFQVDWSIFDDKEEKEAYNFLYSFYLESFRESQNNGSKVKTIENPSIIQTEVIVKSLIDVRNEIASHQQTEETINQICDISRTTQYMKKYLESKRYYAQLKH